MIQGSIPHEDRKKTSYDMSIFVKLLIDLYNLSCFPEIKTNFLCLLTSALFVTVFTRSSQQLQRIKEQVTRNKAH